MPKEKRGGSSAAWRDKCAAKQRTVRRTRKHSKREG